MQHMHCKYQTPLWVCNKLTPAAHRELSVLSLLLFAKMDSVIIIIQRPTNQLQGLWTEEMMLNRETLCIDILVDRRGTEMHF